MSPPLAVIDRALRPGHHASVYVATLVIVAAIVNWLTDTILAVFVARYVVPSLQRARREHGGEGSGRGYSRSVAGAGLLRIILDALAVLATCYYFAQNDAPAWPAWLVFALFFAGFHVPRLVIAGVELTRLSRAAA